MFESLFGGSKKDVIPPQQFEGSFEDLPTVSETDVSEELRVLLAEGGSGVIKLETAGANTHTLYHLYNGLADASSD